MSSIIALSCSTVLISCAPDWEVTSLERGKVLSDRQLVHALNPDDQDAVKLFQSIKKVDNPEERTEVITGYFKEKMASRYYFNWKNFDERFATFSSELPKEQIYHKKQGEIHLNLYHAKTTWNWPRTDKNGDEVSAYVFRHLARQHKVESLIFTGFYEDDIGVYKQYFVDQVSSLNHAYQSGNYNDGINGVFLPFISGRRAYIWLFIHNALLSSESYSAEDQMNLIKSFLAHGADLADRVQTHEPGNHHTRGLVGLYEIAALFSEFAETEKWRKIAVDGLLWHMENEIGEDGFQFERSVFYHMGDIENYYRVARLARNCGFELPDTYTETLEKMFQSLELLSQDNGKVPPLQDCSGNYNDEVPIANTMIMGYDLFRKESWTGLIGDKLPKKGFWLLTDDLVQDFNAIEVVMPALKASVALEDAGYYIMRDYDQAQMNQIVISAGLSNVKPDHQQGDMLGLTLYSQGKSRLPNYEAKYSAPEYKHFKNSLSKNVAIVDGVLQGREWTGKPGGTGFASWAFLPEPEVINWTSNKQYDYFAGTHNGYDTLDVVYARELIFLKPSLLVVVDHFRSDSTHDYSQVWQGNFSHTDVSNRFYTKFDDNYQLDLVYTNPVEVHMEIGTVNTKPYSVFTVEKRDDLDIVSIIDMNSSLQVSDSDEDKVTYSSGEWTIESSSTTNDLKLSHLNADEVLVLENLNTSNKSSEISRDISTISQAPDGSHQTSLLSWVID